MNKRALGEPFLPYTPLKRIIPKGVYDADYRILLSSGVNSDIAFPCKSTYLALTRLREFCQLVSVTVVLVLSQTILKRRLR